MTPNYATHAPQGYMGDWRRGAPMGRPTLGPDPRTLEQLEAAFIRAAERLSAALRLKEDRPSDGFKAGAWEAAAASFREEKDEIRALIKAAQARVEETPKITLRRVRLDAGGYDPQGAYFGQGEPLYWATDGGDYDATFRAEDRDDAKAVVRQTFPGARFYR
jgi:hypothetical protein